MSVIPYATPGEEIAGGSNAAVWLKKLGPLIGLIAVFALFASLRWTRFTRPDNLEIMLLQTAVVAMGALGMTLIIIAGGIDLSAGSNVALSSVVVALMLKAGVNPLLAMLGGVLTGAL